MHDITNTDDIQTLVYKFYKKVREDDTLGPIFNTMIEDRQWPHHLAILANFWETNILFTQSYTGNPMQAHIKVDKAMGNTLSQLHFDRWLHLWRQTVDELFSGENAVTTKKRAEDMAKLILYKVEQGRKATGLH